MIFYLRRSQLANFISRITARLFFVLGLLVPFTARAQSQIDSTRNKLQPLHIHHDIKITGTLSDSVWKKARAVYITHEVQPNDNAPAPVETKVKVLYSQNFLYVGFICNDPHPRKIRAHISDRDNIGSDDFVGIFLDPFNNNKHAYELFVNPLGIQFDAMRTNGNENSNFDMLWYSAGEINQSGYTAVMKIPFKSIHFPTRNIQDWSVQFFRNYPRSSRYQLTWTKVDIGNSCLMCQNGTLTDIKGVENHHTIEFLPYALGHQSSKLNQAQPSSGLDNGPLKGRVGGSISYSPSSTSEIDAVVNPDFSQVETDATKISVNKTFALQYPEKRPFFLKGSDLFTTPENLFYSRTINNPLAAGKFTRKASRYSVAFLTAYDRDTPFVIPGMQGSSLVKSHISSYDNVIRSKYNIGQDSYIGGLLTTRNQRQAHNYVGSIDWKIRLADHYYFNGQAAYSDTRELRDTSLFNNPRRFGRSRYDAALNGQHYGGTSLGAKFERNAKHYNFSVSYHSFSPTFQAQNGFINKTNRRQIEADQDINYYPNTSWLSQGNIYVEGSWRYNFAGQFQERYIYGQWSNTFAGQTRLSVSYLPVNDERFRGHFFTGLHRTTVSLRTKPLDVLSLYGSFEVGRNIHRTKNPELGHGYNISAQATIKPSARLELNLNYHYSTLSPLNDSKTFYSGDITRLKANYNFSRRLFARVITQYNSFNKRIQVYPLLYYKLNPFTKFYIGMTDYLNHFDPSTSNSFKGYRQTNREFFVKIQYLFRK